MFLPKCFSSHFSWLVIPVLSSLFIVGAGCANLPSGSPSASINETSPQDSSSTQGKPTDTPSSPTTVSATSGYPSGSPAGTTIADQRFIIGPRQILVIASTCDTKPYTDTAKQIFRQKNLGTYTVILAEYLPLKSAPSVSVSDTCLKMSFPGRDLASLKQMKDLLQADLQTTLETTGVSATIQDDLPGSCEKVADTIAKRFPKAADQAYARCKALKEQQQNQGSQGDSTLVYDSPNAQCTTKPDTTCSPGMTSSDYIKYAMSFVTPTDSLVKTEAAAYKDIGSLYQRMQKRFWQADTTMFGCSDKFQKPNYYLSSSSVLTSNMECGIAGGDCEDKALTTASLLISSGLFKSADVRVAMGTVKFGNKPTDIGGHAWNEVYLGDHWMPLDPTFGNTCDTNGKCTSYTNDQLVAWDHFNYVDYPVLEYWGWSNNEFYYDASTKQGSSNLPAYWKEPGHTIYTSN